MDSEKLYNSFGSEFSTGNAASRRGSYARYLSSGNRLAGASSIMNKPYAAPQATGAAERESLTQRQEAMNQARFGSGLGQAFGQLSTLQGVGQQGVSNIQAVQQAKELAQLQAASAQSQVGWSAIQAGIGLASGARRQFGAPIGS